MDFNVAEKVLSTFQLTENEESSTGKLTIHLHFSDRAKEVFNAGRELWKYYHTHRSQYNSNASFYDIREYFQGRDEKGRMKSSSDDEKYNQLLADLRIEMKFLSKQIEPNIYEYGFLKGLI